MSWNVSFRRTLHQSMRSEYGSLKIILTCFYARKKPINVFGNPSLNRAFSTKSFFNVLEGVSYLRSPCLHVWLGLAPPRLETLCWLVVSGKVTTADNLRRGLSSEAISDFYSLCREGMETVDHLFLHRRVSSSLWRDFGQRCSLSWCLSDSISAMFEAWSFCPFSGCGTVIWKLIPIAIVWSISKERNDRVFRGTWLD